MLLTRDALAGRVRLARQTKQAVNVADEPLMRSVRADSVRAAASDDDMAKVKEQLGEEAAKGRLVPFTISTERRATDGHVIKSTAWQLDRYRKNPVVLMGHDRWRPRIADSVVDVVDNRLRAVAAFFPRDLSPLSWELGEIAATRGHAASVGFRILRAMPAPDDVLESIPWALDIDAARLDEWSLVTIGADEDALVEARADGMSTAAIADAIARMLDEAPLRAAVLERLHRAASGPAPTTVVMPPETSPVLKTIDDLTAKARQLLQP